MKLKDVYAVHVWTDPYGDRFFIPRSQALLTKDAPKLWVKKADAQKQADLRLHRGQDVKGVVRFRLVEIQEETPNED